MVSMASANGSMLEPGSDSASLSPASPSSSFYPKSSGGRSPGLSGAFEPPSGVPFVEYLKTWNDQHVSRWLTEIKCPNQVATFQANDIRGDILLELDQVTLKEMGVASIGDRLRIINAVKNLRHRSSTRSTTPLSFENSPRTQSRLFLNSDAPTISHSMSDSLDGSPTSRLAGRLGTVRPPPLHISSNSQGDQPMSTQSETNGTRTNPPLRPLPNPNQVNTSSSQSVPNLRPLPNTSRIASPSIRTPSRLHMGRARAPDQADPSAFANSPLPPAPGPRSESPFGVNHNSKGSLQVASSAFSAAPPSRGSSRTPALNPLHTRNMSSQGGAISPGVSPRPHAYAAAEPPSNFQSGDFRGGSGGFTNYGPGNPNHQANPSYDDLRRKLFKFQLYEEGHSKVINISECPGGVEIMDTVLKKFGKGGAKSSDFLDEVETANGGIIVDGWAIHLDWGMGDGLGNPLTEAELMAICHAAADDPVRERGLTLRRIGPKRPKALASFLGEDSIPDFARNASPTPGSDSDGNIKSPNARAKALNDLQSKPKAVKRASAISVLSGLGVPNPERILDPTSSPGPPPTPSASAGLKLPQRFRTFFGQRPPSEFIADHAAEYFPFTEKKVLARTARNSIYRQSTISTMSSRNSWVPPVPSRNNGSNPEFSPPRSSVDLPPPVPEKILSPAAANFPKEDPPRVSISTETGDVVEPTDEMPTPINKKRMSQMSMKSTYSGLQLNGKRSRPVSMASRRTSMIELRSSANRGADTESLVTLDEVTASVERRRESKIFDDTDSWTGVQVDEGEEAAFPSPAFSQVDLPGTEESDDVDVSDEDNVEDDEMTMEDDSDDSEEDVGTPVARVANAKWIKGALIGAGSFGKVYLGMDAANGLLMAVKQVELPTGSAPNEERKKAMLSALEQEIDLLKDLQHQHIVQYLYSSLDELHLNIFLEYVGGGSITAMLQNYGAFEEELVRTFTGQILQGLAYLHSRDIIHRDIKGGNILVDTTGGVKISDFGISKKVGGENLLGKRMNRPSLQGSVFWMAPEVVKQKAHTSKADIWSVGCLCVEMLTGEHPWAQLTQMQAIFKIGSSAKPEIPPDISNEAEDFLKKTFDLNYEARPSADELLKHPWIVGKKPKAKTTTTLEVPTPT